MVSVRLAGVDINVPVVLINGAEPGPTFCVTAAVHGAEYPCVEAAKRLALNLDPASLRGQVIVVPIVNPVAFRARSIYVTPLDGKNLNRQFPGKEQGTFSEALAYWLFNQVIRRGDYYIDLHGGDMIEALIPFGSWARRATAPSMIFPRAWRTHLWDSLCGVARRIRRWHCRCVSHRRRAGRCPYVFGRGRRAGNSRRSFGDHPLRGSAACDGGAGHD